MIEYIVYENDDGKKLKQVVSTGLSMSNRLFNKLKLNHHIYINNNVAFANDVVHKGDVILKDWLLECKTVTKKQKQFTMI